MFPRLVFALQAAIASHHPLSLDSAGAVSALQAATHERARRLHAQVAALAAAGARAAVAEEEEDGEEEEEEEEEGEYEGGGGKRGKRGARQAERGASGARVAFAADYEAGQLLSATGRPQRAAATGPKLYVAPAVEGETSDEGSATGERKRLLLRAGARRSGIDGDEGVEEDDENNVEEEEDRDTSGGGEDSDTSGGVGSP